MRCSRVRIYGRLVSAGKVVRGAGKRCAIACASLLDAHIFKLNDFALRVDLAARVRGAFPPILIGHSLGSVVIQRYIESFPAERLIFVNPLSASTALERLLKLAGSKSDITLLLRDPAFVETLAGNDEMMREMLPALGKKEIDRGVIEDVLSSPPLYDSNTGVPAFLAYGDRDPLVTSDEAKQLAETYGVYGAYA